MGVDILFNNLLSNYDASRMKRVRFTDHDTVHEVRCEQGASSSPGERNLCPSADSPKTSEYKYYKKLLRDTGSTFCYPSDKPDKHLKKFEASICKAKMNNMVRDKFQVSRSPSPIGKVLTPIQLNTLLPAKASRNSESRELQYKYGETFPTKRQKLLQSAAEILSLEVDELYSKRSDLLSELLLRLGIKSDKKSSNAVPRSRWMELKVKSPLVSSPKLDMPKLPQIPRLNLPSSTLQHVDNSLPDFWSDEGNKRIHSWGGAAAGNTYERRVQPKRSQSDCVLYCGSTSQDTDGKSTSGFDLSREFSFIRNGPYTLDHMPSELDCMASKSLPSGWHSLELSHVPSNESSFRELRRTDDNKHECALRREWCPRQLLGWDDINLGSECESDDIFRGMEMALKPDTMQPISSGDDHQWSSNDTMRSCSPAMFPVHPFWNSTSKELVSDFCLLSEVKTNIYEERDYPVEGSDHLPLILSHAQNLLSPREDHSLSDNYKWSRVFSPPPHSFRITETFRENIYPSLDELLGLDLEFAWKSLFSNEISGEIHSLSHSSLQLCEEKEKSIFAYPNFEHISSTGVLTNQSMQKRRLI